MGTKRVKKYQASFKFKAVMESFVKNNVAEVARNYQINANQLSAWRKEFLKSGFLIFEKGKVRREE